MTNFWKTLPKPFTVLAPMEDVTDVVFREIVAEIARPDVFFTEFTSSDGLASRGRERVARKLMLTENQRPCVAQIWGNDPAKMGAASAFVGELGFDGIDINMGCPVPAVIKKCAGAGMIGNMELTKKVLDEVKKGAGDMPVSVKTRLGYDKIITDEWIGFLLDQNLAALAIHGRVATQMSKGDADWGEIGRAVKIRDVRAPETLIVGNGDIKSYAQVLEKHKEFGVDGAMIGRGIFHDPWIFEKSPESRLHKKEEYISILIRHLTLYEETWGRSKNFEMMKKFFKMYVKDFEGANELRQQLMERRNFPEMMEIIDNIKYDR
jgi:nifR3 family TIM-barrel protein